MKRLVWVALSGVGLLAACSGQEAGKGQFRDAVERYVGQQEACLPIALDTGNREGRVLLGTERIALLSKDADGSRINEAAIKQMTALESAGLYEKVKESGENEQVFVLTEEGRKQTQVGVAGRLFCIGKQHVEKVQYYTEPATNAAGLTVSRVVYESGIDLSSWAKRVLRYGSDDWKHALPLKRLDQATLVKTNDGWRDVRELPATDAGL